MREAGEEIVAETAQKLAYLGADSSAKCTSSERIHPPGGMGFRRR
jgi:hypothetical protein